MFKRNVFSSVLFAVFWAGFCGVLPRGQATAPGPLTDAAIQALLDERVDPQTDTALVVGLIRGGKTSFFTAGKAGPGGRPTLDARTVFEVGSTTKAFTGALLAVMVEKGEVKLDDPVAKYLPDSVKLPQCGGKPITLLDLATHTSGLPRLPANLAPKDPLNPYADYTVEQLYACLSNCPDDAATCGKYNYSNLGMGLLGHLLARRAGKGYEELLEQDLLKPLGMKETSITLSPGQKARLAPGHDPEGAPAANWDLPTLAGAGALRSTAADMLKLLAANLADQGPLAPALQQARIPRRSLGGPDDDIGLGWHLRRGDGSELVWHNGETGGYHAFMGFDRKAGIAVVVLHNATTSIDDLGFHLLHPAFPLLKGRKTVSLSDQELEAAVGVYELTPAFKLTVTREGGQLFLQATNQPRVRIHPESATEFFFKVVDAQLTFVKDAEGKITSLVLHQGGQNLPAKRIP